jgi:hypothetical protein
MAIRTVLLIALDKSDLTPSVRAVANHLRPNVQDTEEGALIYCDTAKEQGQILRRLQRAERNDLLSDPVAE